MKSQDVDAAEHSQDSPDKSVEADDRNQVTSFQILWEEGSVFSPKVCSTEKDNHQVLFPFKKKKQQEPSVACLHE